MAVHALVYVAKFTDPFETRSGIDSRRLHSFSVENRGFRDTTRLGDFNGDHKADLYCYTPVNIFPQASR